jgi:hypothetical protein
LRQQRIGDNALPWGAKRVKIHATASWPARDDRRAALVWLAVFWIFVGVGFGFDVHNYLREQPPVPKIVHYMPSPLRFGY